MYKFDELLTLNNRKSLIGMKAEGLVALRAADFNVPDGFVVTADEVNTITAEQLSEYIDNYVEYAVRSSSASEDLADSSFAGQYESFLNVKGCDNILDAVRRCAESIHSERVKAYAERSGIDISKSKMSVIVQRMVKSEKSGVAFSSDSVNGRDKEVIIEAVTGLGDTLVGGYVTPDYYSYNWYDDAFTVYKGGVLTRDEVAKIALTVLDIQVHYGFPADVEWAVTGDVVHILQSRPITTFSYKTITGEWTTADFRDGGVSSCACKTLMSSLYGLVFNPSFSDSLKEIKLLPQNDCTNIYDIFYARPYWNLTLEKVCFAKLPGFVEREIDEDMGIVPAYNGDGVVTKTNLKSLWSAVKVLTAITAHIKRMENKSKDYKTDFLKRFSEIKNINLSDKSSDELHGIWVDFIKHDYFNCEYTYFKYIFCNMILSTLFKDKIKKYLSSNERINLLIGLLNLSHMRPVYEMWEMSRREYSDIEFAEFVTKYKHHSQHELDISYPNWDENPNIVREMISDFKQLDDSHNPNILSEKQQKKYLKTLSRIPKKLHKDVERMRTFLWWREEFRDISTKHYYLIRKLTLALGKAWEVDNILESADDIFFLSVSDIETKSVEKAVKNKLYYQSFINFKNPNEIGNRYTTHKTRIDGQKILKGVACSGETITAIAKVINDIHDVGRLEKGDILVTKCTDPAWTAVFSKISGVITETGGMLSHAAVVSREYGIACILTVKNATEIIKDGDVITMDCRTGEIYKGGASVGQQIL